MSDRTVLRWSQCSSQEQPAYHTNAYVHQNLTPHHVDVGRPQWVSVSLCLLYSLPYCQEPKANCEACCHCSKLKVFDRCRHDIKAPFSMYELRCKNQQNQKQRRTLVNVYITGGSNKRGICLLWRLPKRIQLTRYGQNSI